MGPLGDPCRVGMSCRCLLRWRCSEPIIVRMRGGIAERRQTFSSTMIASLSIGMRMALAMNPGESVEVVTSVLKISFPIDSIPSGRAFLA